MTEYDYPLLRLRNLGFVTLPRSPYRPLMFKVLKIWSVHVGQSLMILKVTKDAMLKTQTIKHPQLGNILFFRLVAIKNLGFMRLATEQEMATNSSDAPAMWTVRSGAL